MINIGITLVEVVGGTLSGSLALLSDAGSCKATSKIFYMIVPVLFMD